MNDALDRAAAAAALAAGSRWDAMSEPWRTLYRKQAAVVLGVMADDLRAVHTPHDVGPIRVGCTQCVDEDGVMADWPCPTVRILDAYVGSNNA